MSTIYRMTYHNAEEVEVQTDIVDLSTPEDDDTIIPIKAGEEGSIQIGAVDNDELKYGIKPTRCIIRFINSDTVNLDTFSTGEDGRFKVFVRINTKNVFNGWLEQGGITEPFLPTGTQIVNLTAIDGLGYLGDIDFVGFDGEIVNKLRDSITPAIHVARCLFRTGFEFNINVIDNRREENNPGQTWFDTCSIFPEFAEDGANKSISCREVLERILSVDSYLKEAKGEWWIIRTTELRPDFPLYVTVFDSRGNYLSGPTETTLEKAIGSPTNTPFAGTPDATSYFSEAATVKTNNRPYGKTELDYNYELPAETLCNSSFARGDFIADLADEVDADGNTLTVKSFNTDCWTYERNVPPDTQDSVEYTKVLYEGGQEKERYVHMEAAANNDFYYLLSSMRIPVGLNDKFTIGCSARYGSDLGGGSGHFILHQIWARLYADDGTFWNLHAVSGTGSAHPGAFWQQSDVTWGTSQQFCDFEGESQDIDFTDWQLLTFDAASCPRSGDLEILLINNQTPSSQTKDFSSLSFEHIAYIDGSYKLISGQSYTERRSGDYRRTLRQEVFISNSPSELFKGAIKVINVSSQFVLAGKFYEGQQFPADNPTDADKYEFGELQIRAFHNQNRNTDEKIISNTQGLGRGPEDANGEADQPDLLHRFYLRDQEPSTNTRVMQLVNQDINWRTCAWTGTLIQNFDTNIGFADDEVIFQYLSGSAPSSGGGSTGGGGGSGSSQVDRFGVAGEDDTAGQARSFNANSFGVQIYGDQGGSIFEVDNLHSGSGTAMTATSNGICIYAVSTNEVVGVINAQVNAASTNVIIRMMILVVNSTGTPSAGFGGSLDFQVKTTVQNQQSNTIVSKWVDATDATRTSQMILTGVLAGTNIDLMKLNGNGSWQITPITATAASAITPSEGMILFVSSTDATFTSIGLWAYENGAWSKK